MNSNVQSHSRIEPRIIIIAETTTVELNAEKVRHLVKSGDSTETMATEEMLETIDRSEASQDSFDEYKEMVDDFNERMGLDSEQQHHAEAPSDNHATITDDENTNSKEEQSRSPHDIAKYKAEIWYPECRDCGCCQGFKHGCTCYLSNNGVCMCVTGGICVTCVPDDDSVVSMNSNELWYELWCQRLHSQLGPNELQFHPIERQGSHDGTNTSIGKVNSPCRFFFSAAGCRHGDACSYNHKK